MNLLKMHIVVTVLALAIPALTAELPPSYTSPEQHNFKVDGKPESIATHSVSKDTSNQEHPIFKPDLLKNQGRARIEPVKPTGPIINYDRMLSDQPASTEVNRIDVPNYGYAPGPSEVAYPDIPYAPGYGYDNGYPDNDRYSMYSNELLEPDTSAFGLIWSQVPNSRTLVSYVGRTISWLFSSIFVLLVGSMLTIGACTYTNLCSIHFHGIGPIHEEMRSLISPERLEKISTAADFVKTAIDKYQKIQTVTELASNNKKKRNAIFY
ncbi:hypothetical protein K1T71_006736 [Dendrolimus kikuchii]|uniref:Uncharacterized protein n=1 Tax=Dendrolimus kikuchii TaxID=765133 RepID=A0ACC1D1P4_9NEOP|nr:hypothetical protein K1T71_006736 [Dendrolimus kikuchii]